MGFRILYKIQIFVSNIDPYQYLTICIFIKCNISIVPKGPKPKT